MRNFAKCWDTDGAGLPTESASSLTESSPAVSAHKTRTRVASASIRKTSTTSPTCSSPSGGLSRCSISDTPPAYLH
ncbi:Uncharacterised protein [Mycobacteroides abscessus subsp. abscessus]|nr:Uncharacterised protein [Mycobacteroides abscessus subsp. abscessus]SKV91799.1 Uncharacterised protein [Mycobacteroides abscessus subsp. abscessus]